MTNKEKFLAGQPFKWHNENTIYQLVNGSYLVKNNQGHFMNVSKIEDESFNVYTFIFGKEFSKEVRFSLCNFNISRLALLANGYSIDEVRALTMSEA
ncbi:MAG: hypothetical protein LBK47_03970 [Prevotellaceae bacterium]|jgi:hypothetical protein|nr:hypothetical protein [Prevotellaceae bacterium]